MKKCPAVQSALLDRLPLNVVLFLTWLQLCLACLNPTLWYMAARYEAPSSWPALDKLLKLFNPPRLCCRITPPWSTPLPACNLMSFSLAFLYQFKFKLSEHQRPVWSSSVCCLALLQYKLFEQKGSILFCLCLQDLTPCLPGMQEGCRHLLYEWMDILRELVLVIKFLLITIAIIYWAWLCVKCSIYMSLFNTHSDYGRQNFFIIFISQMRKQR